MLRREAEVRLRYRRPAQNPLAEFWQGVPGSPGWDRPKACSSTVNKSVSFRNDRGTLPPLPLPKMRPS
jgi:hypothetical protein